MAENGLFVSLVTIKFTRNQFVSETEDCRMAEIQITVRITQVILGNVDKSD